MQTRVKKINAVLFIDVGQVRIELERLQGLVEFIILLFCCLLVRVVFLYMPFLREIVASSRMEYDCTYIYVVSDLLH